MEPLPGGLALSTEEGRPGGKSHGRRRSSWAAPTQFWGPGWRGGGDKVISHRPTLQRPHASAHLAHTPWRKVTVGNTYAEDEEEGGGLGRAALHTVLDSPFEFLQGAGGMRVGGGRGLLRLQAVRKGVQMLEQQAHHQHVLLSGRE